MTEKYNHDDLSEKNGMCEERCEKCENVENATVSENVCLTLCMCSCVCEHECVCACGKTENESATNREVMMGKSGICMPYRFHVVPFFAFFTATATIGHPR